MDQTLQHRPLWQLLTIVSTPEQLANLSCEECFTLFEFLADEAYQDKENPHVHKLIRDHFTFCPDCRVYYEKRLVEFETELAAKRAAGEHSS